MLIQQLFVDMIAARKGSDPTAKSLLVTLYSEAARVGKDRRNGDTTDEEVLATVKKFAANVEETIRNLEEIHRDTTAPRAGDPPGLPALPDERRPAHRSHPGHHPGPGCLRTQGHGPGHGRAQGPARRQL